MLELHPAGFPFVECNRIQHAVSTLKKMHAVRDLFHTDQLWALEKTLPLEHFRWWSEKLEVHESLRRVQEVDTYMELNIPIKAVKQKPMANMDFIRTCK